MDNGPPKLPSRPPPKRPKSSQQKGMTLHPPLASLARLPNGELRVPSPLARYASMRSRASSVLDYNSNTDYQESKPSPQRSLSTSPQYLVSPEVMRSSILAAQKSFQSRVRTREWVPKGSQENVPREFLEITQQHKSPNAAINETLLDPLARERVTTLRATLEQLFFKLQNTEQLQDDPVFGPDTGADLELGESNMPIEDISKFTTEILQPENPNPVDGNFVPAIDNNKNESTAPATFALSKHTENSQSLHSDGFHVMQTLKPPDHDIISQDHDGEINDFLLGDACKIGHLLTPLPSVELDKQIVSFSDNQGLSEMDIFSLAFDTCIDYLSNCNGKGQLTEILQTLSRVKAYYVKRITTTPTQLTAYQEAANILDSKLQVTMRDLKEATHENQDLKIKLTTLKGNYAEAVKRIDELVCQNTMQTRDITILTRRLNVAQDQVNQLSFTLDVIKSELLDERNKTKRLAATANRFKSNLERVGDRAAQAERKANYGELQILDLEKQKKTMMAEMAMLQEQLATITGAFAKERGALVSENERLTMENNDFQTTLASGGMFFASGAEEGEANSEVLVRVANKIHKRTDMSPHAKLAATTILRLCAEDSRVACRRLGITNDGLSSIMWLVTAAKNSDNVATFLTHLHGQYSSYFVAKGTAVQTKDSYVMDAKTKKKKRAIDAAIDEIKNLQSAKSANPNEEISVSADNRIYNSFDNEFTDQYAPSANFLLRKSQAVLLSMHRQLQAYRDKYEHLSMDSDKEFDELQALLTEYYRGMAYNDSNSSMNLDKYQKSSHEDRLSIQCDSDFNHIGQSGVLQGADGVLDENDSRVYGESSELLTRRLDTDADVTHIPTRVKENTQSSTIIPLTQTNKTSIIHNDRTDIYATIPENSSSQQNENALQNISMESIDFGGHYVSSQLIDESTELFVEADSQEDNLQVHIVDIPEDIIKAANIKIAALASLSTSQEQKDKITSLLQNLLYKSKYNGSILQIFDKYADRIIQDNTKMKEMILQQKSHTEDDAGITTDTDRANHPEVIAAEVIAASETEKGIAKLSQVLDSLFAEKQVILDESSNHDSQQADIEVFLDGDLSACTKETINWVVDQVKPKIERARRKRTIKHRIIANLAGISKKPPYQRHHDAVQSRKPLPSACTSTQQAQRESVPRDQLDQIASENNHPDGAQQQQLVPLEVINKIDAPADKGDGYLYYKDASGEVCAIKHSLVRTDNGSSLNRLQTPGTERSALLQGSSFQSNSPNTAFSPPLSSSIQHRLSSKGNPIPGSSTPRTGNIVDLNTIVLGDTPPAMDMPPVLPTVLMQSKRITSPARSTNSRQSPSRPKSGSLSRRHFYGLSTQDILARVSENINSEHWTTDRPLSSPMKPGYSPKHVSRLEPKFIVQSSDGTIRFIDASTLKRDASEEIISTMQGDGQSAINEIYYVEGNNTGMMLVTLNPEAIPASLNTAIEKQETILINDSKGNTGREQIHVTIMSIKSSANLPLPSLESIDKTSTMFTIHPLPPELAKAIKDATAIATVATQTTPMLLDEMISTGELLVKDAFWVIDRLFAAMHADPLQMERHLAEPQDDTIRIDSIPIDKDDAIDLTMSHFTNIPLFPDIYVAEQLYNKNESKYTIDEGEVVKNTERDEESVGRTSPLLSLLQRHLPTNLPLVTSGLLGPSGIVKYSDSDSPSHPASLQSEKISKRENNLQGLRAQSKRPKTAINLTGPVALHTDNVDGLSTNNPDFKDQIVTDKSINIASTSVINQSNMLNGDDLPNSVVQTVNTDVRYNREDMTLSIADDDLVDNSSRTYKEAVTDLLSMSQRHKSLPAQRLRQSLDSNKLLSGGLSCEHNITDGSLLIESLTPEEVRSGSLLLRKQQQPQNIYSIDLGKLGKDVSNLALAAERTSLQNRRLENKILGHNARDRLQPQLLSATFIRTMQDTNSPQEPVLTYSEYLHARGRESIPSYVANASCSTRPYLRLHPRHGHNILFTQCNPLEPPEGTLLQFVGGPFAALVTKFGSFKQYRCAYPHELLEIAHPHSKESQMIYPCILSTHTDIVKDFSSKPSTDNEKSIQDKQINSYKMQNTFACMIESIKHLPSVMTIGESTVKTNGFSTDNLRVMAKQFSNIKMLMPKPGETVLYVRHSALTVRKNDSKPILPTMLQLLQELSPRRCEIFTIESGCIVDTVHRTYIKIPINNAYLKSSTWTLKLIRAIYSSRLSMEESYITVKEPVEQVLTVSLKDSGQLELENEPGSDTSPIYNSIDGTNNIGNINNIKSSNSQGRFFNFDVIHGGLSRQEAESLPHFLLYYAKNRYGVNAIVAPLLWSLIISVCHHQYDNNEIYLFARFLFGDLDFDFYLTYLDVQRALGTPHRDTVDLAEVPELLQVILPNWSGKRRYSLCESIYSCRLVQRSKQTHTISNIHLSQMILVAYGGYRRSIFESMTLVWSKISAENFLTEGGFREFCDTCVTLLNFNSITEAFYAFSVQYRDDISTVAHSEGQNATEGGVLVDTVHNLSHRRMYYTNFIDFYLSYCLGRYAIISRLTLDEAMRGTYAKRSIQMASKVYERLVTLSQDIATRRLSSAETEDSQSQKQELIKVIRKVFNHLNLASCDISAYDSQRAIDNMRQGINLLTDCCMDARSEAASIVLGGGVAALSAFITRNC